jgi:hypothetical protein
VPGEAEIAEGTIAPGSPRAICISPGFNQVLYSADAYPGRIDKLTLVSRLLGVLGESGQAVETVWLDSRNGLPCGECAFRCRVAELARAVADSARLMR